jgi:hypothetical protein
VPQRAPPSTIELAALSRVAPAGDELDTFYRVRRLPDVRDAIKTALKFRCGVVARLRPRLSRRSPYAPTFETCSISGPPLLPARQLRHALRIGLLCGAPERAFEPLLDQFDEAGGGLNACRRRASRGRG